MKKLRLTRKTALSLFLALKFANASKWNAERMTEMANGLDEVASAVKLKDPNLNSLLVKILEALERGDHIEVVDGEVKETVVTAPAKASKKKVVEEEDDEETEDDEEESDDEDDEDEGEDEGEESDDEEEVETDEEDEEEVETDDEDEEDDESEEDEDEEEEEEEEFDDEDEDEDEDELDEEYEEAEEDDEPEPITKKGNKVAKATTPASKAPAAKPTSKSGKASAVATAAKPASKAPPAKSDKADKPKKEKKEKVAIEKDKFGYRTGTRSAKVNAAISDKPLSIKELEEKTGTHGISSHLGALVLKGFVKRVDGHKYVLASAGVKAAVKKEGKKPAKK